MRALGLFLLEGDLLLAQLFGALALEAGVVARIEPGAAVMQVQRVRADAVEEFAVAFDLEQLDRLFAGTGLTLQQPFAYGNWCGRPGSTNFYQDGVVAVK